MSASKLLNFTSKPKTYISQSRVQNGGRGVFTNKNFIKDTPMIVYYGTKLTDHEIYNMYMYEPQGSAKYYQISDYLRGTPNGFVIHGDINVQNPNLQGVYVNDISSIDCQKDELTSDILKKYAQTAKLCNVHVIDTTDYPVYITTRRIKKNDELYVHYGIGYWLAHIGFSPDEISTLNDLCKFDDLY